MKKETLRNIKKEIENNKPVDGIGFPVGNFIVYGDNDILHIAYMEKSGGFYKLELNKKTNKKDEYVQEMPGFILSQLKETLKNTLFNKIAA